MAKAKAKKSTKAKTTEKKAASKKTKEPVIETVVEAKEDTKKAAPKVTKPKATKTKATKTVEHLSPGMKVKFKTTGKEGKILKPEYGVPIIPGRILVKTASQTIQADPGALEAI